MYRALSSCPLARWDAYTAGVRRTAVCLQLFDSTSRWTPCCSASVPTSGLQRTCTAKSTNGTIANSLALRATRHAWRTKKRRCGCKCPCGCRWVAPWTIQLREKQRKAARSEILSGVLFAVSFFCSSSAFRALRASCFHFVALLALGSSCFSPQQFNECFSRRRPAEAGAHNAQVASWRSP